jgi:hypothetical protein
MTERSSEDLLRLATRRTQAYDFTVWFWGDAIAVDGLLDAAEILGDEEPRAHAERFIHRWSRGSCPGLTIWHRVPRSSGSARRTTPAN